MNFSKDEGQQKEMLETVRIYVLSSHGLKIKAFSDTQVEIEQGIDGKSLTIRGAEIEEIIPRLDGDGESFLQVNFSSGQKILVTQTLIGFKPAQLVDLDMAKLPKVVTTPDILSVFEAIQEAICAYDHHEHEEVEVLRRVYDSVVIGGEAVGFDLSIERSWIVRIPTLGMKITA